MSRFSRMRHGALRTWAPPESPLRIEYSPELLREVRLLEARKQWARPQSGSSGELFGISHGKTLRIVSTHERPGLQLVGVCSWRMRGEVFLAEEDLEEFEKTSAAVALVVAGQKAGFFVRDSQGSLETVRSYLEFPVDGPAPEVVAPPQPALRRIRLHSWHWALPVLAALAMYPLLLRHPAPGLNLAMREDTGELRISWNPLAVRHDASLLIDDGPNHISIPLEAGMSSTTYARRTGEIRIELSGSSLRYVGPTTTGSDLELARASLADLQQQASALRAGHAAAVRQIAMLEHRLQTR